MFEPGYRHSKECQICSPKHMDIAYLRPIFKISLFIIVLTLLIDHIEEPQFIDTLAC